MSDRSLLEDAAKAAGMRLTWGEKHKVGEDEIDCTDLPYVLGESPDDGPAYWNPLEDDGDALRLAIQLKIVWSFQGKFVVIEDGTSTIGEALGYDSAAAVRRAIVRKAAWITRAAAAISSQNRGVE